MSRTLTRLAAILPAAAIALAGCGSTTNDPPGPTTYGEAGACYYVDDPSEVVALQDAGYCPRNWSPAPMPSPWYDQWAWYYSSPRYYDTYVPVSRRTVYVQHVKVIAAQHPKAVTKAPKYTPPAPKRSSSFNAGSRQGGDQVSKRSFNARPAPGGSAPRPASRPAGGGSSFKSGARK